MAAKEQQLFRVLGPGLTKSAAQQKGQRGDEQGGTFHGLCGFHGFHVINYVRYLRRAPPLLLPPPPPPPLDPDEDEELLEDEEDELDELERCTLCEELLLLFELVLREGWV